MLPPYSVLMSVYDKERPEFLQASMESMFTQTVSPDDFVLVCDGPLTEQLNAVVAQMQQEHSKILKVVRLNKNSGLGNALNVGLQYCKYELVARMDSDDISRPERCEKQLAEFAAQPELDILSGTVEEFIDSTANTVGKRVLPETSEEILRFCRKRNPFNHPAVMFNKKSVLSVDGYSEEFRLFEDYYLWVRMLSNGSCGRNLPEPLLYMRTSIDIYKRRGGWRYARDMLRFHSWMHKIGCTSWIDFFTGAVPHAVVCIMPNFLRKSIYLKLRVR